MFFGLMVGIIQQMSDCAQLYLKELYRALGSKYNEQGQFLTSEEVSEAPGGGGGGGGEGYSTFLLALPLFPFLSSSPHPLSLFCLPSLDPLPPPRTPTTPPPPHTHTQLSVALNNMYHVRTMVKQLPEKLKLDSCYGWLEKQEAGLGQNARVMIERVLESADEDSDNRVRQIVDDTAKKVCYWVALQLGYAQSHDCLFVYLFVCMFVCMFVCVYICLFVCMYVCLCVRMYVYSCVRMYVCTYLCVYICLCVHMFVCTYVCLCVRMYVCVYVCMFVCTYVCLCVHMYVCVYVCMFVCMYVCMYVCIFVFVCL